MYYLIVSFSTCIFTLFFCRVYLKKYVGENIKSRILLSEAKVQSDAVLYHSLMYDSLTNLPKLETLFDSISHNELTNSLSWKGLVCLDIYKFTDINECYGRFVGDQLLCLIAKRLTFYCDKNSVSRSSGGEFCFYLELESKEHIDAYIDKLNTILTNKYDVNDMNISIAFHYGISEIENESNHDLTTVYYQAVLSNNKASQLNFSRPILFDVVSEKEIERNLRMMNALPDAIRNGEIKVYYQPQIEISTGNIISESTSLL